MPALIPTLKEPGPCAVPSFGSSRRCDEIPTPVAEGAETTTHSRGWAWQPGPPLVGRHLRGVGYFSQRSDRWVLRPEWTAIKPELGHWPDTDPTQSCTSSGGSPPFGLVCPSGLDHVVAWWSLGAEHRVTLVLEERSCRVFRRRQRRRPTMGDGRGDHRSRRKEKKKASHPSLYGRHLAGSAESYSAVNGYSRIVAERTQYRVSALTIRVGFSPASSVRPHVTIFARSLFGHVTNIRKCAIPRSFLRSFHSF